MIVPSVGIVIGDYDGCLSPLVGPLETIDRLHEKLLLQKRTGIASVTILISSSFEIAYGW